MAILRHPIKCANCGQDNYFKMHPLTEYQKLTMWCGDQGGEWPTHCSNCGKAIVNFESLTLTKEQEEYLKNLGSPSSPSLDSSDYKKAWENLNAALDEIWNTEGVSMWSSADSIIKSVCQAQQKCLKELGCPSTPTKEPGELDRVIESVADRMKEGEVPERDEFIDRHLAEIKRLKKYYADKAAQRDSEPKKFIFSGDEQEWKEMSRSEKEECIAPEWRLWNEKHKEPSDIPEEILEKIWIDAFQYATNRPQEDVGHIRQQGYVDGAIAMYRYSQKQPTTIDLPLSDVNFYILKDQCVKQSIEIRFLKRQVEEYKAMADRYLYENCRHTIPTKTDQK